jgi:hypothetical protein
MNITTVHQAPTDRPAAEERYRAARAARGWSGPEHDARVLDFARQFLWARGLHDEFMALLEGPGGVGICHICEGRETVDSLLILQCSGAPVQVPLCRAHLAACESALEEIRRIQSPPVNVYCSAVGVVVKPRASG